MRSGTVMKWTFGESSGKGKNYLRLRIEGDTG
jgi:hypothetical protein